MIGTLRGEKTKIKKLYFLVGDKPEQNYADFLVKRKASPQTERN